MTPHTMSREELREQTIELFAEIARSYDEETIWQAHTKVQALIDTYTEQREREARKQAYSLGFKTAKKSYTTKAMFDKAALEHRVIKSIAVGYEQSTGIEDDLFVEYLEDRLKELEQEKA